MAVLAVLVVAVVAVLVYNAIRERRSVEPAKASSNASVLALTWGPSLCRAEPSTPGCRSGHVKKLGQALLLHGLWPQPSTEQYCDLPKGSTDRKSVALPDDVRNMLRDMMSDEKFMAAHEWYAHGTCSGVTPQEYFGIAAALAKQMSAVLNPVIVRADGTRLSPGIVRDAVDARFGRGTGQRVALTCRDVGGQGPVIYEVRVSLPPVVELRAAPNLADSLTRGPVIAPGCGKGRVVR
jgi:ribonuclease T2